MAVPVYRGACGRCGAIGFVGLLRSGESIALVCRPCFDAGATTPARVALPARLAASAAVPPESPGLVGPLLFMIGGLALVLGAVLHLVAG